MSNHPVRQRAVGNGGRGESDDECEFTSWAVRDSSRVKDSNAVAASDCVRHVEGRKDRCGLGSTTRIALA